jgi:hypothetical protein
MLGAAYLSVTHHNLLLLQELLFALAKVGEGGVQVDEDGEGAEFGLQFVTLGDDALLVRLEAHVVFLVLS